MPISCHLFYVCEKLLCFINHNEWLGNKDIVGSGPWKGETGKPQEDIALPSLMASSGLFIIKMIMINQEKAKLFLENHV